VGTGQRVLCGIDKENGSNMFFECKVACRV